MTNYKWSYVAKGHYSTPDDGWTVHVLNNGAVYKTHPSRATADVTGSKADKYIESAQTKFPVRGKKRAEPRRDPDEEQPAPAKVTTKPDKPKKSGVTKKKISAAAKKFAKGAGEIIGTTRAFVTEVGESEQRAYAKRKAPPPKKAAKTKKPAKTKKTAKAPPLKTGRSTIVRKKHAEPVRRRAPPAQVTEHPLEYLVTGTGALPPSGRKPPTKRRREQSLEEYLGF